MLSKLLFISGGEIFIILILILIFFGSDKIPEFMRMSAKWVSEFKKATDDIKREFNDSSSGVLNDIRSISNDLTDSLTKEIAEPVQKTAAETAKTFEDLRDQYESDIYYDNKDNIESYGNEFQTVGEETGDGETVGKETEDRKAVDGETDESKIENQKSETV